MSQNEIKYTDFMRKQHGETPRGTHRLHGMTLDRQERPFSWGKLGPHPDIIANKLKQLTFQASLTSVAHFTNTDVALCIFKTFSMCSTGVVSTRTFVLEKNNSETITLDTSLTVSL